MFFRPAVPKTHTIDIQIDRRPVLQRAHTDWRCLLEHLRQLRGVLVRPRRRVEAHVQLMSAWCRHLVHAKSRKSFDSRRENQPQIWAAYSKRMS